MNRNAKKWFEKNNSSSIGIGYFVDFMEIISIELIVDQIENLYVIQNLYVEYLKPVCSKKSYFKIVNGSLKHENEYSLKTKNTT